ncbi:4340_t:CDS:2 [Cetraspora pellucida]|uniref:4340_t:CDS:1 n=1 Tax=Cetraspora pellucida TaxID=1433469 RepID=A0A9N8VQ01_9GLOM|nr:4340_t:CDS:2 [Cetraspora pellucida]
MKDEIDERNRTDRQDNGILLERIGIGGKGRKERVKEEKEGEKKERRERIEFWLRGKANKRGCKGQLGAKYETWRENFFTQDVNQIETLAESSKNIQIKVYVSNIDVGC